MAYSVVKCVNGNNEIVAEGKATVKAARVNFFQQCVALENAPDVQEATVSIFDEHLNAIKTEHIKSAYYPDVPSSEDPEQNNQPQGE